MHKSEGHNHSRRSECVLHFKLDAKTHKTQKKNNFPPNIHNPNIILKINSVGSVAAL